MKSFVFTLFIGSIMLCEATEDDKETDQLTPPVAHLAPQVYGGEVVPKDDQIPQLSDSVPNLIAEAICEVQNTGGTEEIQSPVRRITTGFGFGCSSSPQAEYHLEAISTGSTCPSTPRCESLPFAEHAVRLERSNLHSRLNPNAKAFRPSASSSVQLIPPSTSTPTQSSAEISRDAMVFQSLLMMLSIPLTESEGSSPWRQYVSASIRQQKCSVMELCHKFDRDFKCGRNGHLMWIKLHEQEFDHLNLLMIPNTVRGLMVKRANLKTVSKWADLRGKSLIFLDLSQNPDLQLNLDGLRGGLSNGPLENLAAIRYEIFAYLEMENLSSTGPAFLKLRIDI